MAKKLHKDTELQKIFIKEEGVLYRLWIEDGRTFKCILVPQVLQDFMIILAHDYSGHNGSRRTYNCLKRQYYWPGIRKQIFRHCKKCKECVLQNQGQPEKCFGHFDSPDLPMEFICMDLVGDWIFYSYFRTSWNIEAFLLCMFLISNQTLRVVPHGTKGTGPRFVTRPVYLRSQSRNNTNTVSF